MRANSKPPLSGTRILAVEQYGAGPAGTVYLADLGAEVIKIENLRELLQEPGYPSEHIEALRMRKVIA